MSSQEYKVLDSRSVPEHPRMLFFLCCLGFFIGVFFGSDGMDRYGDVVFMVFPLVLGLIIGIRKIIVIFTMLSISILWYMLAISRYDAIIDDIVSIWPLLETKQYIVGTIEKSLYKTEINQAYRLSIDNFDTISPHTVDIDNRKPKILIEAPENLSLRVWDTIVFTGKLQGLYEWKIDDFEKYTFYNKLSWKASIYNYSRITEWRSSMLEKISESMERHIFKWFPRDTAGIILGMTIWRVELMSRDIQDSFRTSGISHILVVSGSNITFLIILLGGLLKYLPIKKHVRIPIICIFVLIYSTLVWWDIPVLRSTIMGLLGYYAIEQSSRLSSIAVLLGIGMFFLMYSPLSLVYDPAFWLSFAATMSIILYYKKLYGFTKDYSIPNWIWSIIALSLSASIWTIPITLYHFGEISLWALFANIAIASVIWWILFFSVWYIILGFIGVGFLYILGWVIYLPIEYIVWVSRFFETWGTVAPSENIKNVVILIFLAFFSLEILKDERIVRQKDQKIYDPQ